MADSDGVTCDLGQRFSDLAIAVNSAETVPELLEPLIAFDVACGIEIMSYHHLPPPGALDYTQQIAVVAHGFPKDWVDRYEREFALHDPITRHAMCATDSFFWSEAEEFDDLSARERYFLQELRKADLGDGLAIPVFGPRSRNGYIGLGFGKNPPPDPQAITFLQAAAQMGHRRYCHMLLERRPVNVHLSPREGEILNWVARGKSNAVIGEILSISGHTVDTHLRRTFSKLGVQDRVTAALRGAALGLV